MTTPADDGLYKLVIIGGGPAGVGVLIRAARTGFLPRLLDPQLHGTQQDLETSERCGMKQKGVAILHDDDASSFGSGNLGHYQINSNTFAKSLLSSVLDEKPELDPPESIKKTFLEHVREHESTQRLEQIGLATACLVEMGNFLRYVGGCVLQELASHSETSTCLLNTSATKFDVLESGIIRVEAQHNGERIVLHTEHLALAMGGRQELPSLDNPVLMAKMFTSETCLRADGFARLREHLLNASDKKVCIVGGSHSSFSVAWMLLNKFNSKTIIASGNSVTKSKQQSQNQSSAQVQPLVISAAPVDTTTDTTTKGDADPAAATSVPNPVESPTTSVLPLLKELAIIPMSPTESPALTTKLDSIKKPLKADPFAVFKPKDITILHRTPIRCYYASRKDAESDSADGSHVDRTGCVNTFTGLREDSKALFKDVKAGKETRVRLFQVNQHGCQNLTTRAYESASAIVWCCGYKTRMIPGFDASGNEIQFYEENGVVKLDLKAQLQVATTAGTKPTTISVEPFPNVLGLGLGFSLRSVVDEMGTETRADGVTVYHRRGATLVLAALFGPRVFGSEATSFEEMVEKVRVGTYFDFLCVLPDVKSFVAVHCVE